MLKITLQKNYTEIPIVDEDGKEVVSFKFDKTDKAIEKLEEQYKKITEMAKDDENFKDLENRKKFVKAAIDGTFGKGSFDKLYKLNPSLTIVTTYYIQLCLAVKEDIGNTNKADSELLNRYMKG